LRQTEELTVIHMLALVEHARRKDNGQSEAYQTQGRKAAADGPKRMAV